jgi:hypothetical protein
MLVVAIPRFWLKTFHNNMASPTPDDLLLLIRCPSCSQRFKVGEDLREKTVECGACESRFRINDEVIVRGRKFYPGERKDPALNRFQRVPLGVGAAKPGQQGVRYGERPDPAVLEPASPLRVLAGLVGVAGMAFMALLLMFGASRGGMLDGMPFENRMVMAGFACVMGIGLLIYANPRARGKALIVSLLMSVGLLAIPFTFTAGSKPLGENTASGATAAVEPDVAEVLPATEDEVTVDLRNRIGTDPLEKEINRLAREGSTKQAVGLWLRGLSEMNRILIRDYIFRTTGADPSSANYYPRGDGNFLMVITGAKQTLPELAEVVSLLGQIEKIHTDISVIEVRVKNENFTEGPIEKLTRKDDPAFYDLNKRELESIDLERVRRAVMRLSEAEPKVYRSDISRKLINLLGEEGIDFKGNISRALSTWSEQPGPASEAAVQAMKELMEKGSPVPQEMVALIVKEKNVAVIPLLDQLWFKDPTTWETLYGDLGPPIEDTVLRYFPTSEGSIRHSIVRLLGRVGGQPSLQVLRASDDVADPELKVLLENSRKAIEERLAR